MKTKSDDAQNYDDELTDWAVLIRRPGTNEFWFYGLFYWEDVAKLCMAGVESTLARHGLRLTDGGWLEVVKVKLHPDARNSNYSTAGLCQEAMRQKIWSIVEDQGMAATDNWGAGLERIEVSPSSSVDAAKDAAVTAVKTAVDDESWFEVPK